MLLWPIRLPTPAPAPDRRLDMLDMLDIDPPDIREARLARLELPVSSPLEDPKKGFPMRGMEATAGTSLIISNPWSSFLVFSRLCPPPTFIPNPAPNFVPLFVLEITSISSSDPSSMVVDWAFLSPAVRVFGTSIVSGSSKSESVSSESPVSSKSSSSSYFFLLPP